MCLLVLFFSSQTFSQDQVINGHLSIRIGGGEVLGEGKKINFKGVQVNTDELSMFRFNRSYNDSDLRISIGDDLGSPGDRFVVGTTKWADGLYYPHFMVRADGRVGIGTEILGDEILGVRGKIRAAEIKVESQNWPDYVFAENYNLTSLPELERYILKNKHLPDVPEATKVQLEGIEMGKLNSILIKKIEELTLHLIQKDKEITDLKSLSQKVQDLEKKMNLLLNK